MQENTSQPHKPGKSSLELKVYVLVPNDFDETLIKSLKLNLTSTEKYLEDNTGHKYLKLFANKL